MWNKTVFLLRLGFLLSVFPFSIPAAPKMVIDTAEYKAGTVYEGNTTFLRHTFSIRNEGDSVLDIFKIKPSCGCITVKNDSVILPQGKGLITMVVDLREVRDINYYEYVVAHTNDPHWPRVELGISGTLEHIIYFEPESIVLPAGKKKDTVQDVILRTGKNDLRVVDVSFVLDNPPAEWLATVPCKFTFDKNSTKVHDTVFTYRLRIFYAPVDGKFSGYGNFVVQTNHPDKPELQISGALDPLKWP
jgi:hypothetical protein